MLNVMLLSAGVTTGWHLAQVAQQQFSGISACTSAIPTRGNWSPPPHWAGRSTGAAGRPGVSTTDPHSVEENHIDVIVPLIDQDLFTWAADAPELAALGVRSTAPLRQTAQLLTDKKAMAAFCRPTACPRRSSRLNKWSRAAPTSKARGRLRVRRTAHGHRRRGLHPHPGSILQEKCDGGDTEITAEVFNAQGKLRVFCRERVVTKSGVCTKMRPASRNRGLHLHTDRTAALPGDVLRPVHAAPRAVESHRLQPAHRRGHGDGIRRRVPAGAGVLGEPLRPACARRMAAG